MKAAKERTHFSKSANPTSRNTRDCRKAWDVRTQSSGFALPHWLDAAARSHPNSLALSFSDSRWTYTELRQSVVVASKILTRARAGNVGRIGILSANRPGYVVTVHAATRMAAPFVP